MGQFLSNYNSNMKVYAVLAAIVCLSYSFPDTTGGLVHSSHGVAHSGVGVGLTRSNAPLLSRSPALSLPQSQGLPSRGPVGQITRVAPAGVGLVGSVSRGGPVGSIRGGGPVGVGPAGPVGKVTRVGPTVTRVAGPAGGVGPAFSSRPLGGANGLLATSAVPTAVAGPAVALHSSVLNDNVPLGPVVHPATHNTVHNSAPVVHHSSHGLSDSIPVATEVHHSEHIGGHEGSYDEKPDPFHFEYGVHDDKYYTDFSEQRTGDEYGNIVGEYQVALPDGRIQYVTYKADANYGGTIMEVSYKGEARHPESHPVVETISHDIGHVESGHIF